MSPQLEICAAVEKDGTIVREKIYPKVERGYTALPEQTLTHGNAVGKGTENRLGYWQSQGLHCDGLHDEQEQDQTLARTFRTQMELFTSELPSPTFTSIKARS
jgi:hypothetical protein